MLPSSGTYTLLVSGGGVAGDVVTLATTLQHCGDGLVASFETCDDGNASAGDGCGALCGIEPNQSCAGEPSSCQALVANAVKLASGRKTLPPSIGIEDGDAFGYGLSAAGDLDGDGVPDAISGVPGNGTGASIRGAAWPLLLRADGGVRKVEKIDGTTPVLGLVLEEGDEFGTSAAWIGDLDGSGRREVAVGAPGDADPVTKVPGMGAVWILFLDGGGTLRREPPTDPPSRGEKARMDPCCGQTKTLTCRGSRV